LTHRVEFLLQLDRNVITRSKYDDIIGADCKPKYGMPLLSVSFDTSSLALKGVKAIAINLHYVNKKMEAVKIMLACKVFSLPKHERDYATSGTANNLAIFVYDENQIKSNH
jgi:hypothetical protein